MISEGQVVLFSFPKTDQKRGKLRPVLILRELPGEFGDWLICMISSQLHQIIPELDEAIRATDSDFVDSGLKVPSVIRVSRLAVVNKNILIGQIGKIEMKRLTRIKKKLTNWINA